MLSKLLGSSVVIIGLLLAGVQKGSADQLFYCKNPAITNQPLILYAASPTCPPGTTVTSINVAGGALGGGLFSCVAGSTLTNDGPLAGSAGRFGPGVQFGSGIGYAGGSTFLLQPGIYQVQISVPAVIMTFPVNQFGRADITVVGRLNGNSFDSITTVSGIFPGGTNNAAYVPVNFDELFQITTANTVVGFDVQFFTSPTSAVLGVSCKIIFTRLQ
jgi:hypothetical protein